MSKYFSNRQIKSAHNALYSGKSYSGGHRIFSRNSSTQSFRFLRKGSERIITQNTKKESANTTAVVEGGQKISWVIDDNAGYVAKVTTNTSGETTVTNLK